MVHVQQTCSCGKKYWPTQAWIHNGCATNTRMASDSVTATNANATNAGREVLRDMGAGRVDRREPDMAVVSAGTGRASKTKNRRSREAYNAYQREYMRKRRAAS